MHSFCFVIVILQAYGNYLYMNHHYEEYDVFVNLESYHRVCHQIVIFTVS